MYNSNQQYLPCVILVNTSKHMEGSEEQLKDAVKEIINAIDRCEMSFVDICLIAFNDDISIINPFVPVSEMEVPDFFCCGMAKTNEAIRFSLQQIKDRCTLYRQNSVTYHLPWLSNHNTDELVMRTLKTECCVLLICYSLHFI